MQSSIAHRLLAAAVAGVLSLSATPALAWGHQAHAIIDRVAIEALPQDGPAFLREYIPFITASATLPDKWRAATEPFAKIEEDPNHGWFREQFAFLKPVPRSRYAFLLALYREHLRLKDKDPASAARMNVRWTGTLPFAVMEQYGQLVAEMRMLRAARGKGDDAQARVLEQNCAHTVVRLGHYIGDGAQPLHTSVNSDGWRGANPLGYTQDGKIHALFESKYVAAISLSLGDIRELMRKPDDLKGDLFDQVLAFLDRSGDQMEDIYRLEKRGALADPQDEGGRELVHRTVAAGASMLRDMIARAWRESATHPGAPDPLDQAHPAFDPTTGSAPPPNAY
jgi:hypothetical protein